MFAHAHSPGAAGCDGGAQALAEQEKFDLRAAVAESLTPLRAAGAKVDLGAFASPIDVDRDVPGDSLSPSLPLSLSLSLV